MEIDEAKQLFEECFQKHKQLLIEISNLGFLASGSITERYITCGTKGCACHDDPTQRHGPYLYWTSKVNGKTVSKLLKGNRGKLLKEWVENRIRLDSIIQQLKAISSEAIEPALLILQDEEERLG